MQCRPLAVDRPLQKALVADLIGKCCGFRGGELERVVVAPGPEPPRLIAELAEGGETRLGLEPGVGFVEPVQGRRSTAGKEFVAGRAQERCTVLAKSIEIEAVGVRSGWREACEAIEEAILGQAGKGDEQGFTCEGGSGGVR